MARIRTIKPEFFRHEELYEAEKKSGLPLRVAYAGLWTVADREGRFRWKPRVLVLDVLPFDDVDFTEVLDALAAHGFIVRYQVGAETFGVIPSFKDHQHVNMREPASHIPAPDGTCASTCENIPAHGEGKGREQEGEGKGEGGARAQDGNLFSKRATTIPPHWKPKGLAPSAAELDRFVAHHTANGTECVDWEAKWVVWRSRIADFGEAKSPSPAEAPAIGMTWVSEDDPRWPVAAAKHLAVKGTPLIPRTSRHAATPSHGAFVESDWLEKAAA